MLTLGIETSGKTGEIALLDDEISIESRSLSAQARRHAQTLVSEVDDLLRTRKLRAAEVELIAVSIGPGSFTGLRVGVVFAKTWCYATGAKLAAVDTLHAVAVQTPRDRDSVHVISDAQRGELYIGRYELSATPAQCDSNNITWRERTDPIAVENAKSFAHNIESNSTITGPVLDRYESLFPRGQLADAASRHPRAATVAQIGRIQAVEEDLADLWTLEPFYIRKSAAEEKLEASRIT